jgi:IMP dehydrogenase
MDTITESHMATAMATAGGIGIIHRYNSIEEQVNIIRQVRGSGTDLNNIGAAVGVTGDYEERACALYDAGARILCVDVAHGHHSLMKNALTALRAILGNKVHLMAGNVATLEGFDALADWGADSIRVGIGGGSICSTRLVTGHGMPTLQSILDCAKTTHDVKIIADGGIKTTGDMIKAYAAGADFVIIGSMLAGTKETPGEVFFGKEGKKYKVYRGMASAPAQNAWRGKTSTPEGVSTTVPYRGSVKGILQNIAGGIRSGLSYSGASSINELQSKAEFILQSFSGLAESTTHILRRYK